MRGEARGNEAQVTSPDVTVTAPPRDRPIDIEADWTLMRTCNFRCTYCFWDAEDLGRRIAPVASVERLAAFFDDTGFVWLLHLTGGEPFIYPEFVDLCRLLTRNHLLSLNTNADSTRRIQDFAQCIDPARVRYINAGIHIDERVRRRRTEAFLDNVRHLRERGFAVFVTCVMHPGVFPSFENLWKYCSEQDVFIIPKAFQGAVSGREYPQAYSSHEREIFRLYSRRAAERYADLFNAMPCSPTVDPLLDAEKFLDGLPDHRGSLCNAGHTFVRIRENGEIRRCGSGDILGNVVHGTFTRRPGPGVCSWQECPYFCEKHLVRFAEDGPDHHHTLLPLV